MFHVRLAISIIFLPYIVLFFLDGLFINGCLAFLVPVYLMGTHYDNMRHHQDEMMEINRLHKTEVKTQAQLVSKEVAGDYTDKKQPVGED